MIVQHPDSKYVDDAVLLIGKSYYEKGEYPLAITKFEGTGGISPTMLAAVKAERQGAGH